MKNDEASWYHPIQLKKLTVGIVGILPEFLPKQEYTNLFLEFVLGTVFNNYNKRKLCEILREQNVDVLSKAKPERE